MPFIKHLNLMIQKVEQRRCFLPARAANKEPCNIHKEVTISIDSKHAMIVCREVNRRESLQLSSHLNSRENKAK